MTQAPESENDATQRYRAPALEKGLDVLELLAGAEKPLTPVQISARLDRSMGELFRVLQVLEARGYAATSPGRDGVELTNKVFSLGISHGPAQNLAATALSFMRTLSDRANQSCHLAIVSGDNMVVIARIESPDELGFAVRLGHQRHLCESSSGLVLYAFQRAARRDAWGQGLRTAVSPEAWRTFEARVQRALAQGYVAIASAHVEGVVDMSCPVMDDAGVIAALTMPYIGASEGQARREAVGWLKATAHALSRALGHVG